MALQSSKGVSAVDLKTGEEVWNFGAGASTTSSTCVYNGVLYVPSNGITALRPRSDGKTPDEIWHQDECTGLLSRAIQHEIDHLKGVYFTDRISQLDLMKYKQELLDIESSSKKQSVHPTRGSKRFVL